MKGKIYSADYMQSTLATFENGYIFDFPQNTIIGRYDTTENSNNNVYVSSSKNSTSYIGMVKYDMAYIKPYSNTSDLYIRDNCIYDKEKRLVAKFEGNPKEALAACVVCVYLNKVDVTTSSVIQPKIKSYSASPSESNSEPNVSVGGAVGDGCVQMFITIIIGFVAIALALYLGIAITPWFWGNLLVKSIQEFDMFGILFYYLPLTACYVGTFAITYKKANSSKFKKVVSDAISMLLASVTAVSIIGGIATTVDIYAQDMNKMYILLVVFFIIPVYWIVSIVPAIVVSLATWIAVKIKLA